MQTAACRSSPTEKLVPAHAGKTQIMLATRTPGNKVYELSDHLGNVRATFADKRLASLDAGTSTYIDDYSVDVTSWSDYYAFGAQMPKRNDNPGEYRYGFNGMEKDDEVKGSAGSSYTTDFRQYDPRAGRWWSTDPIDHAMYSPYSAFDNNPIYYVDPQGADSEGENKDDLNKESKSKKHDDSGSKVDFNKVPKASTAEEALDNLLSSMKKGDYFTGDQAKKLLNTEAEKNKNKIIPQRLAKLLNDVDRITLIDQENGVSTFEISLKGDKKSHTQTAEKKVEIKLTVEDRATVSFTKTSNKGYKVRLQSGIKLKAGWISYSPDVFLNESSAEVGGFFGTFIPKEEVPVPPILKKK